ncbi:MAG: Fe-S cluster assembly protein HesB [Actinomycetota bacterium]|nr:Fe-S cluster assembly protein HesB [Actinomycetota bacterium]
MRKHRLELRGGGGEPVDLWRTIVSHGVASLPPARIDEKERTYEYTLPGGWFRLAGGGVETRGRGVLPVVRRMLRLDEDLSGFYALARDDAGLAWVTRGAGRMLRSPTVFEDVVKTICTTNCTWSATERMVGALVAELGGGAFPSPEAMAEADESFYREVVRAGYRGTYLRSLAASVASGDVDLEALNDSEVPDEEVAARLLALPGVGPYATAHAMMLIGRYGRLILDSWTRPKYARLNGGRPVKDAAIERRFRRYGPWAGLAFWLFLTRDWVDDD